jgi:predicted regulator of Ras-like GTPase activity (Roadblock/LC7/MglB family)
MDVSHPELIAQSLRNLRASTPDIEGSAVISMEGLIVGSSLPRDLEEELVGAMSAAMLSLGERIATELRRGTLHQLYVRGEHGNVVLMPAGQHAVLTVLANERAKLGLLFLDMGRAAKELGDLIDGMAEQEYGRYPDQS